MGRKDRYSGAEVHPRGARRRTSQSQLEVCLISTPIHDLGSARVGLGTDLAYWLQLQVAEVFGGNARRGPTNEANHGPPSARDRVRGTARGKEISVTTVVEGEVSWCQLRHSDAARFCGTFILHDRRLSDLTVQVPLSESRSMGSGD